MSLWNIFDSCLFLSERSLHSTNLKYANPHGYGSSAKQNKTKKVSAVCESEEPSHFKLNSKKRVAISPRRASSLILFWPPQQMISLFPALSLCESKHICCLLAAFFFLPSFRGFIIASCQNVLSELIAGNKTGHACPSLAHQWMQQMCQIGDNGQRTHMARPWLFFFFSLFLSLFLLNSTGRVGSRAEIT